MRLDEAMMHAQMVQSRSQAERLIKLGKVSVDDQLVKKPGFFYTHGEIKIADNEKYVSRAGFKLASVAEKFAIKFSGKTMLDVGSSTGGFTDYALQHGAAKVVAVDVGTNQLHPSLRPNPKIELYEKTDIRDFKTPHQIDIVVIDVSFISLRDILPAVRAFCNPNTVVLAMVKPQFEAGEKLKNKGVIKNDTIRRQVLKEFEVWVRNSYAILDKNDSEVTGKKGNAERFYLLKALKA
jgi:23S rRNA (cytidine1920-2'-O)/16S rRNA (cytidine1409-2'-O)-methyltransferase